MSTQINKKELKHLSQLEKKLVGVLNKINQELSRNEVEYLHIKSLIEARENPKQNDANEGEKSTSSNVKLEINNFESQLNAELDLRPNVKMLDDDEEFDSD